MSTEANIVRERRQRRRSVGSAAWAIGETYTHTHIHSHIDTFVCLGGGVTSVGSQQQVEGA